MRKTVQIVLITVVVTLALRSGAAGASCVLLEHQLPRLDTVVEGRIWAIPAKGRIRLEVSRFYKGAGGPLLEADVVGLGDGQRLDWRQVPKPGDRVLIGFVRDEERLRNDLCHPLIILGPDDDLPAEVKALLGPGHPPTGAVGPRVGGWVVVGLILLAGAGAWALSRRRQHG